MDHRPKYKTQNCKTPTSYTEENLDDLGYGKDLLDLTTKTQYMKEIFVKLGFSKMKIFCYIQHTEKTSHRMGKIFIKNI